MNPLSYLFHRIRGIHPAIKAGIEHAKLYACTRDTDNPYAPDDPRGTLWADAKVLKAYRRDWSDARIQARIRELEHTNNAHVEAARARWSPSLN